MPRQYRDIGEIRASLLSELPGTPFNTLVIKSPWDDDYRCIAWAECYTDRVSWPAEGHAWPKGLPLVDPPDAATVEHFLPRFSLLGYKPCGLDDSFEFGYQKVAIYANDLGVTHMARQRLLGAGWLSKLGKMEDVLHPNLADLEGDTSATARQYGKVVLILKRTWWSATVKLCIFRCMWHAFKFWLYRLDKDWEIVGED
jgi:hypothetical protein